MIDPSLVGRGGSCRAGRKGEEAVGKVDMGVDLGPATAPRAGSMEGISCDCLGPSRCSSGTAAKIIPVL